MGVETETWVCPYCRSQYILGKRVSVFVVFTCDCGTPMIRLGSGIVTDCGDYGLKVTPSWE